MVVNFHVNNALSMHLLYTDTVRISETDSFIQSFVRSFIHSFFHLLNRLFIRTFVYSSEEDVVFTDGSVLLGDRSGPLHWLNLLSQCF